MFSIDQLHTLVQTLTKSEKRYFKLVCSLQDGDKAYLLLFDLLENQLEGGGALYEVLEKKFPGSSIEPVRKHLYRVLMKALRLYECEKTTENKLASLMQDARILFAKGLTELGFDQIEKTKRLAMRNEKHLYYLMAARLELQQLVRIQFSAVDETLLLRKQQQWQTIMQREQTSHQHSALYEILLCRYWKNGLVRNLGEQTRLNDLLLEEHQIVSRSQQKNSFEAQRLHLHFQSVYFLMTNDSEGSLKAFYDLHNLFQRHQDLWTDTPIYYIHLLDGILTDLRGLQRYTDMDYFLDQLSALTILPEGVSLQARYLTLLHRLARLNDTGQTDDAVVLIQSVTPVLERELPGLPANVQALVRLSIARTYRDAGKPTMALKQVNAVLNDKLTAGRTTVQSQLWYNQARLLNLMIHTDLGNLDYLRYELRSVERKLKADKKLYRVERAMLAYLKGYLNGKPDYSFIPTVQQLVDEPTERQLVLALGLTRWAAENCRKAGVETLNQAAS
jgi:hypothetical protein